MTLERKDFEKALTGPHAYEDLEILRSTGAFQLLFPEIEALVGFGGRNSGHKDLWDHTKTVVSQTLRLPLLRWAALFHDVAKPRCFRKDAKGDISFHGHESMGAKMFTKAAKRVGFFTEDEVKYIAVLIRDLARVEEYDSSWQDSAVRRLLKDTKDHFNDLVALARADISTKHSHKRQKHMVRMKDLRERAWAIDALDAIPPALPKGLGDAISKEFGIPPSKTLGNIMDALKVKVESGLLERQLPVEDIIQYLKAHPETLP